MSDRSAGTEKVAIIGMSGRYAGCDTLNDLWHCLRTGRNCVTSVPEQRRALQGFYPVDCAATQGRYVPGHVVGGFIEGIEEFDAGFFEIADREAQEMDPQHRLFLQEAYRTFEDAGYRAGQYGNSRCGVYLGIMNSEYGRIVAQVRRDPSLLYATGQSFGIAAARVAHHLNLKGPAVAVDTTCSSSAVALHLARQALLCHEIDLALAGGVSLNLSCAAYANPQEDGSHSGEIRCRPFDDHATGVVPGEGVGCVLLKRLSEAESDGDNIEGIILGSCVSHSGTSSGITIPSLRSLTALLRDFYRQGSVDPQTVSYLEAHGTGTKFGDAIELDALQSAFGSRTKRKGFCAIGSIKGNIGHGNAAAGVAGLHKALLLMRHGSYVPTINYETPNRLVSLEESAFYINTAYREWQPGGCGTRRAGINSFGAGGTNAHMVVEEYVSDPAACAAAGEQPCAIVLSARDGDRLRAKAHELLRWVQERRAGAGAAELANLAHTLRVGRDLMEERLGFVANSWSHLADSLERYLSGDLNAMRGLASTELTRRRGDGSATGAADECTRLVRGLVEGVHSDTAVVNRTGEAPRRVSLPGYPFRRDKHWIGSTQEVAGPTGVRRDAPGSAQHCSGARATANGASREQRLCEFLRETIAAISKVPLMQIADDTDYFDLGLESRELVQLATAVGDHIGGSFASGMLFDVKNIRELAAAIAGGTADVAAAPTAEHTVIAGDRRRLVLASLQGYSRGLLGIDELVELVSREADDDR